MRLYVPLELDSFGILLAAGHERGFTAANPASDERHFHGVFDAGPVPPPTITFQMDDRLDAPSTILLRPRRRGFVGTVVCQQAAAGVAANQFQRIQLPVSAPTLHADSGAARFHRSRIDAWPPTDLGLCLTVCRSCSKRSTSVST